MHKIDQYLGNKTGSWWVCCNNARGWVWNRKSNREAEGLDALCIMTTKPDMSWMLAFSTENDENAARSDSRFACYAHCHVTWYPLTTGIVASQCPSLIRDAVLLTCNLTPLISAYANAVKTILPQWNIFTANLIDSCDIAFDSNDWWNLLWTFPVIGTESMVKRVAFTTHEITWRRAYVAQFITLLWQNDAISP